MRGLLTRAAPMRSRTLLLIAVAPALFGLTACSDSEYDKCYGDAVEEVADAQKEAAEHGGHNSIKGYYLEQEAYATTKCDGLPGDDD